MFYSNFAQDYEQIFPFNKNTYNFLNSYLEMKNTSILDIGCGTGHYCGKFAEAGHSVTGIDLDSEMINTAMRKYSGVDFSVLNLTDISVLDKKFSFIYSTGNVISHVDEIHLKHFLTGLKGLMEIDSLWIFQVINWDYILTLKNFTFPPIETEKRRFLRSYSDIKNGELTFNTELQNKHDSSSLFRDHVKMHPLKSEKYIQIHQSLGFSLVDHFADFSRGSFDKKKFSADIYVFKL